MPVLVPAMITEVTGAQLFILLLLKPEMKAARKFILSDYKRSNEKFNETYTFLFFFPVGSNSTITG